jgi:hypothetical protein
MTPSCWGTRNEGRAEARIGRRRLSVPERNLLFCIASGTDWPEGRPERK